MGPILGKLLTSLGTEKLLKAIILHLGDFLVGKSSNKLDDKLWAEVKKALIKKQEVPLKLKQRGIVIPDQHYPLEDKAAVNCVVKAIQ